MKFNTGKKIGGLIIGVLLVLLAVGLWFWLGRTPELGYRTVKIEQGDLMSVVSASGTLNPVVSVSVGSQVSGQLKEVLVDFNSPVKKGQLIARIDPELFEYKVRQSAANVNAARAAVQRDSVTLREAQNDLVRRQALLDKHFISGADLDKVKATAATQAEILNTTKAQLAVVEAQYAQARVDLAHTAIRAPVNGIVTKKSVEPGQTVAASLQAPELFVIAQDLRDMQVETSIDEADVGRIAPGQRATFTVDAFPSRTYQAEVKQVRKAALNVQNVVTYVVLVAARNDDLRLLPGMTANVRIITDQRQRVLKVPNAALRFKPSEGAAAASTKTKDATESGSSGNPRAGTGGSQLSALRERMEQELKLDAAQKEKIDQLFVQQREKFAAIRNAPEEERGRMMAQVRTNARAELNAKISEILTPEQRPKFDTLVAEMRVRNAGGASGLSRGRLYVLEQGKPKMLNVQLGISDGSMTEVEGEGVQPGLEVITGVLSNSKGKTTAAPRLGL